MGYLNNDIEAINRAFEKKAALWAGEISTYGITDTIVRAEEDGEENYPYLVVKGNPDQEVLLFADDKYDLISYHRLNLKSYVVNTKKGVGDGRRVDAAFDMAFVCFLMGADPQQAEQDFIDSLPPNAIPIQTDFDRVRVFKAEFSGIGFPLPEEIRMIRITYKLNYKNIDCQI